MEVILEGIIYGCFCLGILLILRYLDDPLQNLFNDKLTRNALFGLGLIIVQGFFLTLWLVSS